MLHGGRLITVDGFAAAYDRLADRAIEPGRAALIAARLRADALDRALIAGADPATSRLLAARARWLTSPHCRRTIAAGIDRVLSAARGPASAARVTPRRANVVAESDVLRELAGLLRADSPLYARGIAMLLELLRDGAGPVYAGDRHTLARRLREARAALAG